MKFRKFASELVKNTFMYIYITNIDEQVGDKYARAILSSCGCVNAIIKRLSDNKYDWVGSIFCEFIKPMEIDKEEAEQILTSSYKYPIYITRN